MTCRSLSLVALYFTMTFVTSRAAPASDQSALAALEAGGPHPAHRAALQTFGQFVGNWEMDVRFFDAQGAETFRTSGLWMFSWVLGGLGIQDVLVYANPADPRGERRFGTTLRYYDAERDRWFITWVGATSRTIVHLEGGRQCDRLVLEGPDTDGGLLRWTFNEVTPDRFHWIGYKSADGGRTWRTEQEMFARRQATAPAKGLVAHWRRTDTFGSESTRLQATDRGWELSGRAMFVHEQAPCVLDYQIDTDASWRTQRAHVTGFVGPRSIDLQIAVNPSGRWSLNGRELPDLDGCIDLDLNFSPSTNTLPLRRLALAPDGSAAVAAAWLRFPGFTLEKLPQTYTRLGENLYRYSSGDFVADLKLDAAGLVLDYAPAWQRVESVYPSAASGTKPR